ncbi:UNVERIFIED_CONTAM: hypothetical protein FKN15_052854 [Acipenser sinensis]
MQREVAFLGHWVRQDGIRTDSAKIETVQWLPVPSPATTRGTGTSSCPSFSYLIIRPYRRPPAATLPCSWWARNYKLPLRCCSDDPLALKHCRPDQRMPLTVSKLPASNRSANMSEVKTYDPSGDSTLPSVSKKRKLEEAEELTEVKVKKMKKERIPEAVEEEEEEEAAAEEPPKKKKKKHEPAEEEEPAAVEEPLEKKKKKKKKAKEEEDE